MHPRTSTPKPSTVLRDFLAQARCICCTVRVVSLTPSRAVVEWGSVPYFTARGRRAEFAYYTAERVEDVRPEVIAAYYHQNRHCGGRGGGDDRSSKDKDKEQLPLPDDVVKDRLRDSWLVEQLAYWVEYLEEWKSYREWYVYRAELFDGAPDVLSPGCEGCVQTHRPDGMRRRASSCA
ncbi:hypothetical protein CPLU01_09308 [Colletotrichum plurivorum]|uniref:Uncharacterized protein n=1 Tax=Colletotrichum plurivorum TaxID=2175906 RepID=A0A8H6NBA1_9PEZI|nr:hypothetical protein CPLU01_09308 [Colletotrichum plurivorum]